MESRCALDIGRTGRAGFGNSENYYRDVFGLFIEKIAGLSRRNGFTQIIPETANLLQRGYSI